MNMYKFVYGFLLVIVLGSSGCSDWLDVQPKTSVPEEVLLLQLAFLEIVHFFGE